MQVDIYNQTGNKVSTHKLTSEIFDIEIDLGLVHLAHVMQLANKRIVTAKTKTKGEVNGGGRKPFRQKGTGRARAGSIRSPLWKGGGVTFGPTGKENYKKSMPRKQRRKALFCALSQKAKENNIIGIDNLDLKDIKTKTVYNLIDKLPVKRNALLVLPEKNEAISKSTSNISFAKAIQVSYLNIHDVLKYETLVFIKESFDVADKIWKSTASKVKTTVKSTDKKKVKDVKKTITKTGKEVPAKKPVVKKTNVKKPAVKKVTTKKATIKKTTVKKTTAKKPATKKTTAKKLTTKRTTK